VTQTPTLIPCTGDCDNNQRITINELVLGVELVINAESAERCDSFDRNRDGFVTVDELLAAVAGALNGCQ
jgi:hypothetical protein